MMMFKSLGDLNVPLLLYVTSPAINNFYLLCQKADVFNSPVADFSFLNG